MRDLPKYWDQYYGGLHKPEFEVETGLSTEELAELTNHLTTYPAGLPHPSQSEEAPRAARRNGRRQTPRGLRHGRSSRLRQPGESRHPSSLSGQDSRRGTFNQRHSVLIDIENENEYVPLENIAPGQARCGIHNSTLSEPGVLGFEYGYSRDYPEALVLWEAQFGDFVNVAQAIIDQFISAGEAKWNLLSGLVLLLPHGYEGQGPEHSSARIERFLQLAAKHNIQIAQPSNAAQYFHLLRRQALRHWRKPLVVFTPKSMLRHPDASSPIEDFTRKNFQNVLPDTEIGEADRILVCTGKIGHELQAERKKRKDNSTAIVFLEQLYPFPEKELTAEFARHGDSGDIVWVQEEPANMGALIQHAPPPPAHSRRAPRDVSKAQLQRQPRHRQRQSARGRTKDAADPGLHHKGIARRTSCDESRSDGLH